MVWTNGPTSCLATDRCLWPQTVTLLSEPASSLDSQAVTNDLTFRKIFQVMASSTPNDDWFQNAAAAQIRNERFERAELLNGRTAMIGFVVGVLTEALTGHGIVSQITFGVFGCN